MIETVRNDVPICVPFNVDGENILKNVEIIENVQEEIKNGKIVILKKVFEEDEMLRIKELILLWGSENPVFPHGESPSKYPELNYHRIDDGSVPSVCPHLFHQYAFNSIDNLGIKFSEPLKNLANKLTVIQNTVGNTDFEISLAGLRLKVLQYPTGGGFLTEHTHPLEPQKIGLVLSLSRKNIDCESGAAVFMTPRGRVDTFDFHDIGDLVIFRYNLPHSVSPVNSTEDRIDWSLESGKWSVVLELRDTHNLSHKKNKL